MELRDNFAWSTSLRVVALAFGIYWNLIFQQASFYPQPQAAARAHSQTIILLRTFVTTDRASTFSL